ncbi:MAG TPA: hypothetical protein VLV86_12530 [Vicinamibacterales bacterium]|nr:hypothetical protein [Vicinamibacterales bacterium]
MRNSGNIALIGIAVLAATAAYAQRPPAISGVTGTMATEATIKDEQKAANKIIVATEDGVERTYDAAKGMLVHGGKGLEDLKPGTTVVIHYTVEGGVNTVQEIDRVGDSGLRTTEGIVTNIDRGKKEITLRYDSGKVEKLKLTDRAAVDAGQALKTPPQGNERIVVYYSDEAHGKIAHYFKPKS